MNKNLALLIMFLFVLHGCKQKEVIKFSQLQERNGVYYKVNDEKPFTGQVVEYYKNGQKRIEKKYRNGKVEGIVFSWYQNGQKKSQEKYIKGKLNGKRLTWYEKGNIKSEVNYKDGKFYNAVSKKYEDEVKVIVTKKVYESTEQIIVDTTLYVAEFTNKGAALKSFLLKKYKDNSKLKKEKNFISEKINTKKDELLPFHFSSFDDRDVYKELYIDVNRNLFQVEIIENENKTKLVFKYNKGAIDVTKSFIVYKNSYVIGIETQILKDGRKIPAPYIFGPKLGNNVNLESSMCEIKGFTGSVVESNMFQSMRPGYMTFGKTSGYNFYWGAFDTIYFSVIFQFDVRNRDSRITSFVEEVITRVGKKNRKYYLIATNPSMVFLGPKEKHILEETGLNFHYKEIGRVIN